MKKQLMCITGMLISIIICTTAWADVLDPLDNSSAPVGTKVLVSYFGYQHLPEYENENGTTVDIGTDVTYAAIRPVYFAGKVFGKTWGVNAVIQVLSTAVDGGDTADGLGDLVVGPFIFLYENFEDQVFLSFWEFAYTPTGADEVSNDSWWFQHQLAFGWYPGPWSFDACLNYWQKDEDAAGDDVSDAVEVEAAVAYAVTKKLRVGVQAAWWKDFDDIESGGVSLPGTQGENLKLGLNLGYMLQENLMVNLRYMHDVESKAFTKGSWTYLRLSYVF
ncbi:transporter [uncultured Desulfobacter sp.]|uniref:transporter n=1 Tax=uncultured Desulfobacter sp. TaxID=240139 RepID=UPI002AAC1480|nr:transporter [uncultured Desulfobacter sp.]